MNSHSRKEHAADFRKISYSSKYISDYICDGTICANGGICIPINETEFQCDCPLGYSGHLCTGNSHYISIKYCTHDVPVSYVQVKVLIHMIC